MSETLLVAMSGLQCAGKSAVAAELARLLPGTLLEVDAVEDAVVRAGFRQGFETGLAAYLVAEAVALPQLTAGRHVVVDAANYLEVARDTWRGLADRAGVRLRWVEVTCSDVTEHRRRAESRDRGYAAGLEPRWAGIQRRVAETDPWPEAEPRTVLDSAHATPAELAGRALPSLLAPASNREEGSPRA